MKLWLGLSSSPLDVLRSETNGKGLALGHVGAAFVDHVEFLDNTLVHLAGAAYTHTQHFT